MLIPKEYQFAERFVVWLKEKTAPYGYFSLSHEHKETGKGVKYTLITLKSEIDQTVNYLYVACNEETVERAVIEYRFAKARRPMEGHESLIVIPKYLENWEMSAGIVDWVLKKFSVRPLPKLNVFSKVQPKMR